MDRFPGTKRESLSKSRESQETLRDAVTHTALQYQGETFVSDRSGNAFRRLTERYPEYDITKIKEGYVGTDGRFVDKEEVQKKNMRFESDY
ncbi:hypothetical protein HZC00_03355 [Candidatus Kaiserbacteria bacterium]|nr:hypothetical protein [Candidatus Kaiserbacteria bacterium]